jgi:hypothetical protein
MFWKTTGLNDPISPMVVAIRRFRKEASILISPYLSCDPIFRHCCGLNSQSLIKDDESISGWWFQTFFLFSTSYMG